VPGALQNHSVPLLKRSAMKFQTEITTASARYGLDHLLVAGLVQVESNFNQYAWNPEPRYRYYWDVKTHVPFRPLVPVEVSAEFPPPDFHSIEGDADQEWWGQSASWGLMQVMGAVAREHGCRIPYLTELCDPATNLDYGCRHLARLLDWSHGDVERALAAYNGGTGGNSKKPYRNQAYATKVIAARSFIKITDLTPQGGTQ
jgi:hypothetical protein